MNAPADVRAGYGADFRRLEPTLPGAALPWLHALRQRAFDQFMDTGFPTTRNEDWKYTDVRTLALRRFGPSDVPAPVEVQRVPRLELGGPSLVFIDGHYSPALSQADALPGGARVMNVARALRDHTDVIEPWLGRYTAVAHDGFRALNTAFLQDGAFVYVPRDVALEAPIELVFVASGATDVAGYLRNVIVLEPGSRATVVENYVTASSAENPANLTNVVSEVITESGAELEHYRLVREAASAYHIGATCAHVGRSSRYISHSVTLGGRIARHALACVLEAEGAECRLNGLYAGSGRQHMEHATRVDHHVPGCTSRAWYKGVLDDHARGVFGGRVVVHPQAQRTDASQANHNLLLSEHAEADSRPQFEIYADDVKCAHGSSTGSLDADALFYLRTRGLDKHAARQLLVYAFASDVLARMRLAPVRALLERDLAQRWLREESVRELLT